MQRIQIWGFDNVWVYFIVLLSLQCASADATVCLLPVKTATSPLNSAIVKQFSGKGRIVGLSEDDRRICFFFHLAGPIIRHVSSSYLIHRVVHNILRYFRRIFSIPS